MKDLFPEYYSPTVEEFNELWQKCVFIFDTNVLLDFYEYRKGTREDFFKVLEAIKTRLWIPHQVALEYQRNRLKRIIQVQSNFEKVKSKLTNAQVELNKAIELISEEKNFKKCIPPDFFQEVKEEIEKASESIFNKLTQYKEESIKTNEVDYTRDKIADLFQGKIGDLPANQKELDEIYSEGEKRYKMSRPPGFSDEEKKKDKDNHYIYRNLMFQKAYGDLIIWKQILKEVEFKKLTHIIFITGDRKEDWWRREHNQTIGPRTELVEEILEAGASMFHMYTADSFLKYAQVYLSLQIEKKSIEQVEEISVSNSLSEPEVSGNSSRQSLLIDNYKLSNIESLAVAVNNIKSIVEAQNNIQSLATATNNQLINSNIPNFAKQLAAINNNIPDFAKQLAVINNNIPDFAKQLAAINSMQLTNIYHRNQEINSEYLPDSNASQEVDP